MIISFLTTPFDKTREYEIVYKAFPKQGKVENNNELN